MESWRMSKRFLYCCLLLMVHDFQNVVCFTRSDAKRLQNQIFDINKYNKKVIPTVNDSKPLDVWMSFSLLSVNALNEAEETLRTTGYFLIQWPDEELSWNETEYGGLPIYHWPQTDVWRPDVYVRNSYTKTDAFGENSLYLTVFSHGLVVWDNVQVFQTVCEFDITYYPFDVQTCELMFFVRITGDLVRIDSDIVRLEMYKAEMSHSEWDLIDTNRRYTYEGYYHGVIYSLTLKRKPTYVLTTVVMPVSVISLLGLFVFILPSSSGERAGYSITVFLTLAVFMTIVSSTLPRNSGSVPILSTFLIFQLAQNGLVTMINLALVRLISLSKSTKVPCWVRSIMCINNKRRGIHPTGTDTSKVEGNNAGGEIDDHLQDKISRNEICSEDVRNNMDDNKLHKVVNRLDGILFIVFLAIFLITLITYAYVGVNHHGKYDRNEEAFEFYNNYN